MKLSFLPKLTLITSLIFISFSAKATPDVNNPAWQIDIAPYAWGINMDGRVSQGPFNASVSESFEDIMKHFDGGGMLWLDVYKGPVGAFINGLYADLSDHGEIDSDSLHVKTHFGLVSYGLSFIILQKDIKSTRLQIEPYAGARYTFLNNTLSTTFFNVEDNRSWTDPIIGIRVRDDFTQRWLVLLAADVGEGNPHKQYSYNLNAFLGYKPENKEFKNTTVYFGYRYLYQHYEHESGLDFFEWNMRLFGPVLGINFNLE